jgi:uncharacterized membrane protein YkoI
MKKKVLAGVLTAGLLLSGLGVLGVTRGVFAGSAIPAPATTTTQQEKDSNVQEPSYVGSIKVVEGSHSNETDEAAALQTSAKILQSDAEKAALAKVAGTVVKTTLDNENGYLVYAVEVRDAANAVSDVKVDAGNGTVLTVEAEGTEEKDAEKAEAESSTKSDTDTVQEESQSEISD